MPEIPKSSKAAIDALILSTQTSLLQLSGPVLKIDQIKRFLSVIMDVLDTSILIPEGNEASEHGEKVRKKVSIQLVLFLNTYLFLDKACACLNIFIKTYRVPCCNSSTSFYHLWNISGQVSSPDFSSSFIT